MYTLFAQEALRWLVLKEVTLNSGISYKDYRFLENDRQRKVLSLQEQQHVRRQTWQKRKGLIMTSSRRHLRPHRVYWCLRWLLIAVHGLSWSPAALWEVGGTYGK